MKRRAFNRKETLDEIIVNGAIFFLVVLTTVAALDVVAFPVVLGVYALDIVAGIIIACVSLPDAGGENHE